MAAGRRRKHCVLRFGLFPKPFDFLHNVLRLLLINNLVFVAWVKRKNMQVLFIDLVVEFTFVVKRHRGEIKRVIACVAVGRAGRIHCEKGLTVVCGNCVISCGAGELAFFFEVATMDGLPRFGVELQRYK